MTDHSQGGHVNTYVASSGNPYDYGVQNYLEVNGASQFAQRLGVPTKAPTRIVRQGTEYADFNTGNEVNYTGPIPADQTAALTKYAQLCAQWEDFMLPNFDKFPAGNKIPADLLLPFGDFVKKHGIEAAVPLIFQVTGMGFGDILQELTIWVVTAFGGPMARSFLGQQTSFVPVSGRNQDVYDAIGKALGKDVLYSTTVLKTKRSKNNIIVTVKDSKGKTTEYKGKRLLLAVQPTPANMGVFDLDTKEKTVFGKFDWTRVTAGIIANEALPNFWTLTNLPEAAAPSNFLALPKAPFTVRYDWLGTEGVKNLFRIMLVGDKNFDDKAGRALAQKNFDNLIKGGVLPKPANSKLEYVAWTEHGPMHAHVSAKDLKAGFIQDLYSLQGSRSTFWTGGAWVAQFQTHLWWYNDLLLPKLVAGL